jgi:hypothetical protein
VNFAGGSIDCVDDAPNSRTVCTVTSTGGGDLTVQVDGVDIGTRPKLNIQSLFGIIFVPGDDPGNNRVNLGIQLDTSVINASHVQKNGANAMGTGGKIDMAASPGVDGFRPPDETECVATSNGFINWATNPLRLCAGDGTNSNQLAYLKDTARGMFTLKVNPANPSQVIVNETASASYPSSFRVGTTVYSFTAPGTVTRTGSTCSGAVLWYLADTGAITMGHNGLGCALAGAGVTVATPVDQYPPGSIPLGTMTLDSGVFSSSISELRTPLAAGPKILAGANVGVAYSADSVTISSTGGGSSVTPNAPYVTISGTNYLPFWFAATLPPTTGSWTAYNTGGEAFTQVGDTVVLAGSTTANTYRARGIVIGSTTTLVAAVAMTGNAAGGSLHRCGIGILRPSTGKQGWSNMLGGILLDGAAVNSERWDNYNTVAANTGGNTSAVNPSLVWFRFELTGGNVVQSYSNNGITYIPLGSPSQTDVLGGSATSTDAWAIGASGNGATGPTCTLMHWRAT